MTWRYFITFWATMLGLLSFSLRVDYLPLVDRFGMYQGDLWYFFHYYGEQISTLPFYPIEYPAGYVLIQRLMFFISTNLLGEFTYLNFIYAHALIMIPMLVGVFLLVDSLSQKIGTHRRYSFLYLALSPTLLIAASTNYDLFPIFFVLLGLFLLFKKRYQLSSVGLALGTVIKIFPGFLLPLFLLYMMSKKVPTFTLISTVLIFTSIILVTNVPFILMNSDAWLFPYIWQSTNPQSQDPNTVMHYLSILGLQGFAPIFLAGMILFSWFIGLKFFKKSKFTEINFLWLCFLTCFTAVFSNHVNTPQYLLWFSPLLATLHFPLLLFWWPFDLINSSVLYTYFKMSNDYPTLHHTIFGILVIYLSTLYICILIKLRKLYVQK